MIALQAKHWPEDREVLICPPFTSLHALSKELEGSKIFLGAQNMHFKENGAFTGEVSADMLLDLGCSYVILGHSERRQVFGEDDTLIHNKVKTALKKGITPILCVGETSEERRAGDTKQIVKMQVLHGLEEVHDIEDLVIAYEPVWAIGTGENATPQQAEEVHAYIRSLIYGKYSKRVADKLRILYGGSVNPANVKELMAQEDIDGVLVGGSSLDAEKFSKLIMHDVSENSFSTENQ